MRIVVCIKQIHHVFGRTGRDETSHYITDNDRVRCINPFDIAALELALGVKDMQRDTEVILLFLGSLSAEKDLRRCLSMGADEICQIETGDNLDGWSKSLLLAEAVKKLKADLVFCGEKSMDSGSGQIGPFMAAHLELPFVARVTDIAVAGTGLPIKVERNCGAGKREIVECGLPAIVSATIGGKIPRYPSMANKRCNSQMSIQKLAVGQPSTDSKVISVRVFPARPRPKRVVPPDSSLHASQRIEQLLRGSNVEKKGEMVTGSPDRQVERILAFLVEKEFLPSLEKET